MKITIINTSNRTGSAAIASNRLFQTLLSSGHEVAMLVNEKNTEQKLVHAVNNNMFCRK